nr:MAG TPA: hypothetical protein [Caudoviricetes sp.]
MAKNHLIYKWLYILDGSDALPDPVRVSTIICKFVSPPALPGSGQVTITYLHIKLVY